MFYTVYKTTNLIDGKFYIGVHKTLNPLDDYIGSGKYLRRAVGKYGRHQFRKEVILVTESHTEAYELEARLVTVELVESDQCYNLKLGGQGGFDLINSNGLNLSPDRLKSLTVDNQSKGGNALRARMDSDADFRSYMIDTRRKNAYANPNILSSFAGKEHSVETRAKMSKAKRGTGVGETNSQFGSFWVTDGLVNMKLKRGDEIPDGWKRGRCSK